VDLGHVASRRWPAHQTRDVDHGEDGDAIGPVAVDGEAVKAGDHRTRAQLLAKLADECPIGQLAGLEEATGEIPGVLVRRSGTAGQEDAVAPLDDCDGGRRRVVIERPAAPRAAPPLPSLLTRRSEPGATGQTVTGARAHEEALT
jgi:hypothetical protein